MVESKEEIETKIIFVDNNTYEAQHIFNANAFGAAFREDVSTCITRMAIFRYSVREARTQISKDFYIFEEKLKNQSEDLANFAIKQPDLTIVCYHDNTHYITAICSSLIYLKSFLDVYSKIIVKSINPGSTVMFSKARVDEEDKPIAGGKLINWLRKSASAQYMELSEVILKHSKDWINLAVRYRDTLIHYGDLRRLHRMRVPLRPENPPFLAKEIEPPKMPNGDDVREYVQELSNKVHKFLEETIPLIPNVNMELVNFREFPLDTS